MSPTDVSRLADGRAEIRAGARPHKGAWRGLTRTWRRIAGGAALAVACAAVVAPAQAERELRVVGSDLLGAGFTEAVQEFARREEMTLSLSLDGSRSGLAALQSGTADFGLVLLAPGEAPPAGAFKSFACAYLAAVVLVPAESPLTQVTYRELGGIFGASESLSYTRWGDLGLSGGWSARAITPQAMDAGSGLALELFRQLVLSGGALRSVVLLQPSEETLLRKLESDGGSIALAGRLPPATAKVRVLPVAKADKDVAFGPTPENVHAGDYPLRLPLWLVVRRDAGREQLNFLRFLLGDDLAPRLEAAGWMTLPLAARNQLVFDLEQL